MTAGEPVGPAVEPRAARRRSTPARRSGCRPRGSRSRSASGPTCSSDRFGLASSPAGAAAPARPAARRLARAGALAAATSASRRAPTIRRSPSTRSATSRDRARRRGAALAAARVRPHLVDDERPGDAAQPPGLQGRHEQPHGRRRGAMSRFVWVGDDEPQRWLRGGTYLVARRIRMLIEAWDRTSLAEQEQIDRPLQGQRRAAHRHARARRRRPRRRGTPTACR